MQAVAKRDSNGGNPGFEAELFKAADKLRGNMEHSDYKHVARGLIFLKYISDAFAACHARLLIARLGEQMQRGAELDAVIREKPGTLGHGF